MNYNFEYICQCVYDENGNQLYECELCYEQNIDDCICDYDENNPNCPGCY